FIVQKVLLNIKPQAIFLKGLHIRWFVTEDIPSVLALPCLRHGQIHGPIMLCRDGDLVPETRLPPGYGEALDLTAATPASREPKAALDPYPPMPAKVAEMGHQVRIGKAPIGKKNHLAASRQQHSSPIQELAVGLETHLCTPVFEHAPHQRDSAAALDHRQTNQTVRMPQHRGVQG